MFWRFNRIAVAIALSVLLTGAVVGWRLCQQSDFLAFLPVRSGAQWLVDVVPPTTDTRPTVPLRNLFQCRFALATAPTNAVLTVCAFKNAEVQINGQKISGIASAGKNWKSPKAAVITDLLRVGTNQIAVWVTNNAGPPALWLRLQADNFSLGSDVNWQVSLTGQYWNPAHLATQPVPLPRWSGFYDDTPAFDALKNEWRILALLLAVALGIILLAKNKFPDAANFKTRFPPIYILLAIVLVARAALFVNDAPKLPGWTGFDEPSHLVYIKYIRETGGLPPPDGGFETHQPPLHYLISAAVAAVCGDPLKNTDAPVSLRAVNGVFGLLNCWLALLCLRRVFPNNFSAQAAGLLLAAFLPPQIYLSIGLSNDCLTELCTTAAFYFLLRILHSKNEETNFRFYVALGFALGAAMLSKLSALPAVLVFFFVLILQLIQNRRFSARDWLRSVGMVALICVAVGGWHYVRVALHTGALAAVPRSDGSSWWQTPGFRTASFYLRFGHVLAQPLSGGLDSFADGIYSTLWGDGMVSGEPGFISRPPWNYDLMKAGYLLALPLSLLAFTGIWVALKKIFRERDLVWLFTVTNVFIYLLALMALTLLGPWLSQVKAFYALPAFVPFCALIVAGGNHLAQKNSAWRSGWAVLILVWTLTICCAFWISTNRAEFWRSRAVVEIRQKKFQQAVDAAQKALSLNPDDFDTHCLLAQAFTAQKKTGEAIQQYLAAQQIAPDSPTILNLFATMMIGEDKDAAARAVQLAQRACELTGYRNATMLSTLASAYANNGQISEAITAANAAADLAQETGDADLLKQNQKLIERCRAQNPAQK